MAFHVSSLEPCDACGEPVGRDDANPLVEVRQPRPSDPYDICCVMAGHGKCLGYFVEGVATPACNADGYGVAQPHEWDEWLRDRPDSPYSLG